MIFQMNHFPARWIRPNWPAPDRVQAVMTNREAGASAAPWNSMNLGDHVGDVPAHVQANRDHLTHLLGRRPVFLKQVHGVHSVHLSGASPDGSVADACWTQGTQVACAIMVADCLPVLLCDAKGQWVAAAHAGWRGLAGPQGQGVLETLISDLSQAGCDVSHVMAWLGPCIGPDAFEVGADVLHAFDDGSAAIRSMFEAQSNGQFKANLAGLARLRLQALGVRHVHGNDGAPVWCTVSQPQLFFSHRRDSRALGQSGRMAACIWLGA
ncbi:laccase [Limnohabitans sp. Rim28]|nr:laccase [Limnohabitans sp. Rim28]